MDAVAAVVSEHVWRSARRASFVALAAWLLVAVAAASTVGRWTLLLTLPLAVPFELGAMYVAERTLARRRTPEG